MEKWNEVFKNFWKGKGLKLRITTFGWGVSFASAATCILGDKPSFFIAFLVSALLCHILTWKMIKDIYYLAAAEEVVRVEMNAEEAAKKIAKKVAKKEMRFAKTCAVAGTYFAAVMALPILSPESMRYMNGFGDMISGGVATTIMVGWIPLILIVLGKMIMKRSAKSHSDKVDALVRELHAVFEGDASSTTSFKENYNGQIHMMRGLGIASAAICVGCYLLGVKSLLPEPVKKPVSVVQQEQEQPQLEQQPQQEIQEIVPEETESEESEMEWYNNPNSNGYNFKISQDCLDTYLAYVQSEQAKQDFKKSQSGKQSYEWYKDDEFFYFAIAGMHNQDPFLILASRNDNQVSDELTFCTYGGKDKVWTTDYFQRDYDLMSFAQTLVVNDIYVWCVEQKDKADFYEHTVIENNRETMVDETYSENYLWIHKRHPDDGSPVVKMEWDGKTTNVISSKLDSREIAAMKWFSLDQIEDARAYFSQFTGLQDAIVLQDSADRKAAYENTILQYMPYIEGGAFSIEGNKYLFSSLTEQEATACFYLNVTPIVEFDGGSASSATRFIDIIDTGNGNYKAIKRGFLVKIGDVVTEYEIEVYEISEEEAVNTYNMYCGADGVSSIAEIIQREAGR